MLQHFVNSNIFEDAYAHFWLAFLTVSRNYPILSLVEVSFI